MLAAGAVHDVVSKGKADLKAARFMLGPIIYGAGFRGDLRR